MKTGLPPQFWIVSDCQRPAVRILTPFQAASFDTNLSRQVTGSGRSDVE